MTWLLDDSVSGFLKPIVQRHARATIIITSLLTVLFAFFLPRLNFENVPGKLDLPTDSPARIDRDRFESRFGRGELVLIALDFGQPIVAGDIGKIRELTDTIGAMTGVISVFSITNAVKFGWVSSFGVYGLRPISVVPRSALATDSAVMASLNEIVHDSIFQGQLLSPDRSSTVLVATIDPWSDKKSREMPPLIHLVNSIRRLAATRMGHDADVVLAGSPVLNIALQRDMRRDLAVFGPLSILILVIVMLMALRSWRLTLAGLLTAIIALIWSVGLLPLTGTPMSIGLTMIVPLIFSLTLMYTVHHLTHLTSTGGKSEPSDYVDREWKYLVIPGFLCGITTWAGFISLASSPLEGIREVGVFVGSGVVFASLLANLFLPALIQQLGWASRGVQSGMTHTQPVAVIPHLTRAIFSHYKSVVIISSVIAVILAGGTLFLRVETNHLEYLGDGSETVQAFRYVDRSFGGVLPLEILVEAGLSDAADAVKSILSFENNLRDVTGIGSVISAADFIAGAERDKPAGARLLRPPLHLERGYIPPQVWDMLSNSRGSAAYFRQDDSALTIRIACRAHLSGSRELRRLVNHVEAMVRSDLGRYNTTVTGLAPYFVQVEDYVVSTQIRSFALAFCVVILLLGLLAGSLRLGLAAMIVNLIPVAIILGVMGWLAIPLDISTVMIAAIAIGIVVDDTIHLIYRIRLARARGETMENSLQLAFSAVGRPVLVSSVILALGFGSLLMASFVPTRYFGGLSCVTVIVAAAADLIILPALICLLFARQKPK